MGGWRQHKHLYRKVKQLTREVARVAARKGGGYHERIRSLYRELLEQASSLLDRADALLQEAAHGGSDISILGLTGEVKTFVERTRHVCGTARRRVLENETVPNEEKLFSVFETHTQLYKRGKAAEPVQFAGLALFGVVLAFLCYRTRRLGMGIFAHVAFNTFAVITLALTSGVVRH